MDQLETYFESKSFNYCGTELRPHFILEKFGLKGSATIAGVGSCQVKTEHLVDWEDRLENETIVAQKMLHFIGEFFGRSLPEIVALQRLFVSSLCENLNRALSEAGRVERVFRKGDDILMGAGPSQTRKMSVSIVTSSPVSQLIHVGVNVDPTGAPVPAVGLEELGLSASKLAQSGLEIFSDEYRQIQWACAKVRPVM